MSHFEAPSDTERPFFIEELFFSTTDATSRIRSGNATFARVAGYDSVADLLGRPHNVIRHPDMPRAVFQLMWAYLKQRKSIAAFVKNRATDGRHYWVMALVVPIADGFLSVRFKPSSPIFERARALYARVLDFEKSEVTRTGDRAAAMADAGALLLETLRKDGFPDYDAFMQTALAAELTSRARHLAAAPTTEVRAEADASMRGFVVVERQLDSLFASVNTILPLIEKLVEKSNFLRDLSRGIHIQSLNSLIAASHLRDSGRTLSVVAMDMARGAKESGRIIAAEIEEIGPLVSALRQVAFTLSGAKLQVEMALAFGREHADRNDDQRAADLETLAGSIAHSIQGMLRALPESAARIDRLQDLAHELDRSLKALGYVHLVGKMESVRLARAGQFVSIFEEVRSEIKQAQVELSDFNATMADLAESMARLATVGELPQEPATAARSTTLRDFGDAVDRDLGVLVRAA